MGHFNIYEGRTPSSLLIPLDLILVMFGMFTLLIYLWKIPAAKMFPIVEGFVENMEAIENFEEVFDSAAVFAGAKVKEIHQSERRWDTEGSSNGYQRETRQADFSLNPSDSRTIFRNDNDDLRINIRGNGRQNTRNQNRNHESQSAEYYQRKSEGRRSNFGSNRGRFGSLPNRNLNNPGRFNSPRNQIREDILPSFTSPARANAQQSQINQDFGRYRGATPQNRQISYPERHQRVKIADPVPGQNVNPVKNQQYSYNQFETDGSYFKLSLIQNSTETINAGNTKSTFYSLSQGTRPTRQEHSETIAEDQIDLSMIGEIDISNMDTDDKMVMENIILNDMTNLGNEEKSLMEDVIEMVEDIMVSDEKDKLENVLDKNMEFMNNDEKNLMENILTVTVEMMEERELMMIENIIEKDLTNLNIKEKVLMEEIIKENVDALTSMEIGLMNNILQKDLESMKSREKTLMEDILRMDAMENINKRKILPAKQSIKMSIIEPKEVPVIINDTPITINKAPANINETPILVNLVNSDHLPITNQDQTHSGKILYCQYCILPANSGGFIIN